MFKKLLIKVLGAALYALIGGVVLVGMAIYSQYKAGHGGGATPAAQLTSISGTITDGREVTIERKRRRGGKTVIQFFEVDFKPQAGGEALKLRIDHDMPPARLEAAVAAEQTLTADYDREDENTLYVLKSAKETFVSYEDTAKLLQARADREAQGSGGMIGGGIVLALIGAAGLFWRRKLVASLPAPQEPQPAA